MRTRPGILLFQLVLAISCLTCASAGAQTQQAQWGPPPTPQERQRMHEERKEERREWKEEEWRRHHQRYYGGMPIQRGPYESYDEYVHRVRAQCNAHWNNCATYCNTIYDPYHRAACVANCNNELHECLSGF